MYHDTIAAIASAPGEGGIGIVRISGPASAAVAGRLFRRGVRGRPVDVARLQSHHLYYGHIVDPENGAVVDEVMLARMTAPHTYTREDVVEISCHGGPLPLREVLRLTIAAGARQAEPGEFTLRAFLNGRIDLSQAEAVMGIVSARTSASLQLAVEGLRGALSQRLAPARDALVDALAYLDAAADFPEDEIPELDVAATLDRAAAALDGVLDGADLGLLYREGARIAIVGRPNVGKSSLMNALLGADRAIVTSIAGTTRDVITESISLRGIPATLLDTAGIAETTDTIERLGIERSRRALDAAAIALLVLDGSLPPTDDDRRVAELLRQRATDDERLGVVIALNKGDLGQRDEHGAIRAMFPGVACIPISARTREGIADLEAALYERLVALAGEAREPAMVTLRQHQAIRRARDGVQSARVSLADGMPLDLVAIDVRDALGAVGEVTGEQVSESVLTEIFSRFCVGK